MFKATTYTYSVNMPFFLIPTSNYHFPNLNIFTSDDFTCEFTNSFAIPYYSIITFTTDIDFTENDVYLSGGFIIHVLYPIINTFAIEINFT